MTAMSYQQLATSWQPDSQEKRSFFIISAIVLAVAISLGVVLGSIDVPEKERQPRTAIPPRVAEFIDQRQVAATPTPAPTPAPTPVPIPTPKPKVVRQTETAAERQAPLTEEEKEARDVAANSGLLALGSELADLVDTSDVSAQVGAKTKRQSDSATQSQRLGADVIASSAGQGSGGVSSSDFVGEVGSTRLSAREVATITQDIVAEDKSGSSKDSESSDRRRGDNVRTEEEVTIVFDQNKGQLFSIYNRERRKKPGLKGKLVLEITISPEGKVTNVKIASSELNDPALERRIVARVKMFAFEPKEVEPVTVTFPIEFLPS